MELWAAVKKSYKLVRQCQLLLSGFLANGHLASFARVNGTGIFLEGIYEKHGVRYSYSNHFGTEVAHFHNNRRDPTEHLFGEQLIFLLPGLNSVRKIKVKIVWTLFFKPEPCHLKLPALVYLSK